MAVFDQPISQEKSTVCCQKKNYYEYGNVVGVCSYGFCLPPHVCGFPAEVIKKEVQRNPAKEKYLEYIVPEERLITILGPGGLKLLMGGIGKDTSYGECDWNVNLYHSYTFR